ncbi:MAG: PhoH family protein [Alphaproteobacteria bacterium]|nr:PhoH family protein [Alphaproteobacteria bacterium]
MTRPPKKSGVVEGDPPVEIVIEFDDNRLLARLLGPHNRNLAEIERRLGARVAHRGNRLAVNGALETVQATGELLRVLYARLKRGEDLTPAEIEGEARLAASGGQSSGLEIRTRRGVIRPRTRNQGAYVEALQKKELVFGFGPAGTGKTYLAVAMAASLLLQNQVRRIILSRPAVEAGEKLGFLPGDIKEKVDPYLRPLYDALFEMLPGEQVQRWMESGEIEIAPLAFMRGRTLSHAFVILDEAQNATPVQMRMFLTRLGEGSRMVVTGDPTQTDLPAGHLSGLSEAESILRGIDGVGLIRFTEEDVVRHDLVTRIVKAYAEHDGRAKPPAPRRAPG